MLSTTKLVSFLALATACALPGCKKKQAFVPPPPPDLPATTFGFIDICRGVRKSFTSAQPYSKHADGTPSHVAVFVKDLDDKNVGWTKQYPASIAAWSASDYLVKEAELTACVEAQPTHHDAFTCSYYGASAEVHSRDYQLRIIENATGKVLVNESFTADARTFVCPATVNGSKNWYVDYEHRLYGEIFALEPPSTKPVKATASELYEVCSGTPVPSARAPGAAGAAKVVYFNDATSSFSSVMPAGIEDAADEEDAASYTTVVCVTAKPEKKKASCDFYDKTLELYAGTFEAVVREARTAKIIETKTFKGNSGECPSSYRFGGASTKKWMGAIDPSFKPWVATFFAPRA